MMVTARVAASRSSILFCRIGGLAADELLLPLPAVFASGAADCASAELFSDGILNFSRLTINRSISLFVNRLDLADRTGLDAGTVWHHKELTTNCTDRWTKPVKLGL